MDEATMKRIIEELGYTMRITERIGRKGNGKVTTYIYAHQGSRIKRCLGNERTIAQMDEDALRAHINAKFAQPPVTETISGAQFLDILMGKE